MKSNDDYVRERAELAGLSLSDEDVVVIREKWERTPLCTVDDLLLGIRNLRDTGVSAEQAARWLGEAAKV